MAMSHVVNPSHSVAPQQQRTQRQQLRSAAWSAGRAAYSEAFRVLARNHGAVTSKNRATIEAQAEEVAQRAREAVYFRAGYSRCSDPNGWDCTRLSSPGFVACPFCTMKGEN